MALTIFRKGTKDEKDSDSKATVTRAFGDSRAGFRRLQEKRPTGESRQSGG